MIFLISIDVEITGPMNILYTASILSGILNFVWLSTSSAGSIIAFACIYGIASGSFVATVLVESYRSVPRSHD